MFELMDGYSQTAVIKVIGVGGGGGNAVAHMVRMGIEGVDFVCANTDAQALKSIKVKTGLQIGCNITKGLGAGANPDVGRQAAMEDRDRIQEVIEGADMLFITVGLGGGTGTGAAPVIAQLAKIRALDVISRTSVMSFKGRQGALREIAAQLHVASLVEGSVRRAGDRVRIVAQLIDAGTDLVHWTPLFTVTSISSSQQFTVTNAPPSQVRYYRALVAP